MTLASQRNPWIFGARPRPEARLRLFCFPYAGGGATTYSPWGSMIAPDIEVYPVQLPGRENRVGERAILQFSDLIEALSEALLPCFMKPFVFFGHSMGALIAFGLAQQLRQQGRPMPEQLLLSAYRAPQIPNRESLHTLSEPALIQKLLELDGTRPEVLENLELRQFLLPIMRADFSICESYVYTNQEPLDCPITTFGGLQDKRVSKESLEAWRKQTSNRFTLHMLPGNHFFLREMQQPMLQIITQTLNSQPSGSQLEMSM